MKKFLKIFLFAFIYVYSVPGYSVIIFQAGKIAKAEDFNSNFSEIDTRIKKIEGSSGFVTAKVNGIDMEVASYSFGSYSIKTSSGIILNVGVDGYPYLSVLYFSSDDCLGQPYILSSVTDSDMSVGESFKNPKFSNSVTLAYDGETIFYRSDDEVVKLNYRSMKYNSECRELSGTSIAFKANENDVSITGVASFPLVISGVGTQVILSREIGNVPDISSNNKSVSSNGVKIGYLSYLPSGSSNSLNVVIQSDDPRISEYNGERITLFKDGSYTGLSAGSSETLYYLSSDCSGNSYVNVLKDYEMFWWNSINLKSTMIENNDEYYTLLNQIYKTEAGMKSFKYAHSSVCRASLDTDEVGFKQAVLVSNPVLPVFSLPITIESFSDDLRYIELPEAF